MIIIDGLDMPKGEDSRLCIDIYPSGKVCIDLDLELKQIATASAPKRGKWINGKCSECGGDAPLAKVFYRGELMWEHKPMRNFCPMCGAKMDNASTNSVDIPTGYTNKPTNEEGE